MTCASVAEPRLRALEPEDAAMLYELENDTGLWTVGDTTAPYSLATLQEYIAANTNDIYADRQLRMVIDVCGHAAGCADLFHFNPINRRAEVGIALLPSWRGKGYGRASLRQLASFAAEHLDMSQLYAIVATGNAAALSTFSSCGFNTAGVLRSWIMRGGKSQDAAILQKMLEQA